MTPIEIWLRGDLCRPKITRVDCAVVAECNLRCTHCCWPHDAKDPDNGSDFTRQIEQIIMGNAAAVFAGRTLTPRGERFIETCLGRNIPLGIVDNGFTILRREDLLPRYGYINISLDGDRGAHDRRRGRAGAFNVAWETIMRLKRLGYDPIAAAAVGPDSLSTWHTFEARLRDAGIPLSCSLVMPHVETVRRIGAPLFADPYAARKALEMLLNGMPKLINLYGDFPVAYMNDFLREFTWAPDCDHLIGHVRSGSTIAYWPESVATVANAILLWDGNFYLLWQGQLLALNEFSPEHECRINELNRRELECLEGCIKK